MCVRVCVLGGGRLFSAGLSSTLVGRLVVDDLLPHSNQNQNAYKGCPWCQQVLLCAAVITRTGTRLYFVTGALHSLLSRVQLGVVPCVAASCS